ncbi:putative pectinesterase 66 [Carex rostrata]
MQFHALSSSSFLLFSAYVFLHSYLAVGSHLQVIQTITVDKSGYYGNFKTIQEAINSVPDWNYQWIRVHVHQGVYIEQVIIPKEKQFILLEGHGTSTTVIQWNAYAVPGDSGINTAAFVVSSDNFIARKITFQNSYDYKSKQAVAVAAVVQGDKCSFYNCKFLSYQDTLCDYRGRHYFSQCWIEGGVDFIFGQAASIYEGCTLNSILLDKGPSWFTAHAKVNLSAPGGFVFKDCTLTGSGNMYLGRAWNQYATVLFYNTFISDIVVPLGWDSWQHDVSQITYAEASCTGPGSDKGQRVPWEKQLSAQDWNKYLGHEFIDQERWIEHQAP